VLSKAGRNQLNLTQGTKTKPDMPKTVSSQSPLCQSLPQQPHCLVEYGELTASMRVVDLYTLHSGMATWFLHSWCTALLPQ